MEENMKIIGVVETSFKPKDGDTIKGMTIYATEAIDPKRGRGESAERFFLSEAKLSTLDFTPAVGQEVEVLYNRFGKVATMKLKSGSDDIDFG